MDWCPPSYASLSFHKDDLLRFLNFPAPVTRGVEAVIAAAWSPGIQKDAPAPGSHTFKLKGKPWGSTADASTVAARRLVRDILAHLHAQDWLIVASLGHSVRIGAKDSLVFRHAAAPAPGSSPLLSPPVTPTISVPSSSASPARWLALSIIKNDRMRVDCADPRLQTRAITALRALVDRTGYFLAGEWNCDSYEFRLRDKPWNAHGDTGWARPRMLVLGVLEALEALGWRSYATIAQSTVYDEYNKADSWYFVMEGEPPQEGCARTDVQLSAAMDEQKVLVRTESKSWGSRNPYARNSLGASA